jgi:hypothetical protein
LAVFTRRERVSLFCNARRHDEAATLSASRRQYLDAPPDDGNGSDDAGSRKGTLQDMDLHGFHPDLFATPRESYAIP